jgi:hypothetical protein
MTPDEQILLDCIRANPGIGDLALWARHPQVHRVATTVRLLERQGLVKRVCKMELVGSSYWAESKWFLVGQVEPAEQEKKQ